MNFVLQTKSHTLVSFTADELIGIRNSLNESLHRVEIEDCQFATRLGVSRTLLIQLLDQLHAGAKHQALRTYSRVNAWSDGGSVQAICVTASGDPADMSCEEVRELMRKLGTAIGEAGE